MRKIVLAVMVALVAVSCGGGRGSNADDPTIGAGRPSCTASGDQVSISADNLEYDKGCLAVPANRDFTINFDNREGLPHNVVILKDAGSSDSLFSGSIVTGPKKVAYAVKAMPAGTYRFHCSVHPTQMNGTFIVQ
ncbi:MAG: cupredoxin domain-containing protein [Acidimicrobiales bacterium]